MSNQLKNRESELRFLDTKFQQQPPFAATRKSFDILAERLVSQNSRTGKTPSELFLASLRG